MKIKDMKKKIVPALVGSAITVVAAVPVLASESSGMAGVESALTSSFTEVGSSMTGIIGKVLPIALPILGAVLIVGFGIKIFKKVTNKAG